uniref:Uncharacterized protein n=1 Tax=Vespula pensylvanica TaxID=30213 RepID=A0A834PF44_VESPE|nr:hypothetical protein H0235_000975 [Vespula pensylvanica]
MDIPNVIPSLNWFYSLCSSPITDNKMHDLDPRLSPGLLVSREATQAATVQEYCDPLYSPTTVGKVTRVTSKRQDDVMNYKMTVKAKVFSGFADPERPMVALFEKETSGRQPNSQPASLHLI